ncbi:Multimeric flavodoxin WrbA [Desulfotomaculum arcticum]|uniref:Multimeric flavodoxin WrbA n=1 Tax=Desulfotruncus arcticus DSM 17038 TaxID=1121424 RepID=A0A1I2XFG3_9FIRM|nr:flavodoxin family protein [Desulfotruncus arcticus]SFH12274.1 Multimeric flavodoxin WrbA [Desulfotomaculum arcticum] [Desulfotruncus arcticus DSM 17038]
MFIVAINGSPNPTGNTAYLLRTALDEVSKGGGEGYFLQVSDVMSKLKIPYCLACTNPCEGKCYRGTELEESYNLLRRCDGLIIGSPVYFCTVSAQLKSFWDKSRVLRKEKALINVVGGALAVGAARFGGQETTIRAMQDIMLCQGMTVIGDGYVEDDAGHQGACAQRQASDDQNGITRSRILARRVMEVARATMELRAHRTQGK